MLKLLPDKGGVNPGQFTIPLLGHTKQTTTHTLTIPGTVYSLIYLSSMFLDNRGKPECPRMQLGPFGLLTTTPPCSPLEINEMLNEECVSYFLIHIL